MTAHRYWRYSLLQAAGGTEWQGNQLYLYDAGAVNRAPSGTVTASHTNPFSPAPASALIDGVGASTWQAFNAQAEWVAVDFGVGNAFDIVAWGWKPSASPTSAAQWGVLEYSDDGSAWFAKGYNWTPAWTALTARTFTLPTNFSGTHTSWGLVVNGWNGSGLGVPFQITEIENHASIGGGNQNSGGTATAGWSDGSHPASNAYDGNTGTSWQGASPNNLPDPIWYTLGSAVPTAEYKVRCGASGGFGSITSIDFICSDDEETFAVAWVDHATDFGAANPITFANPNAPSGDATGSAALPTVTVSIAARALANATTQADLPTVTVDGPTASASVEYLATTDLPTVTVDQPTASASGPAVAVANLPTVTVSAIAARAFGTGPRASELAALVLAEVSPVLKASELAGLVLAEGPPPPEKVSELAVLIAGEIIPGLQASEVAVLVLAESQPCVTQRCQVWAIHRRDGVVMRYTSHDRDVTWGNELYKHCNSLDPTASESASQMGSVGSIELTGIIDDSGISEADLYGGIYDDAFVDVWLISWGDVADTPKRIAAGWTGELSQGEDGHKFEVVGPGARLAQQAVTEQYTAACRWVFGDPVTCKFDKESRLIEGQVLAALDRGGFNADLAGDSGESQWANGTVRWTSGRNVGYENEVKSVDFDAGDVVLWALTSYVPEYGDTFDLLPGCDKLKSGGCRVYDNILNHGGFADLPGDDSLQQSPDAQVQ